jgi:restriction endonuclease Mrr
MNPDPLRGGKYVLQAKRYTRTVDVAAVRDLYGTVINEGANRTSGFGPDSREFVKDKPITLIDGPYLIEMLRRHGRNYRIDLDEARKLNKAIE